MKDLKNLECLLPETKELLLTLINDCNFLHKYVMAGGSALTLHLCHRKSEDLDFFTYKDNFNKKELLEYIKHFKQKEIINQTNQQIDLLLNSVKVTFFNAKWDFLKPEKTERFNLAPIGVIAGMKINTLFLRAKYRDYYDLYFLVKNNYINLEQLFEASKKVVEGITFKLMAIALIYTEDIEDDDISHLDPAKKVSKEEIRDFFQIKLEEMK